MVGVRQRVQAVMYAVRRGLGQRRATALLGVSRSMVTYRLRQPIKDAPVRRIIHDVVTQHPTWGKRLVYGWMREQGYDYSACTVYRVYRQSGYAAQWRKRSRKIRRGIRINPTAIQPHEVWCMDFAEDRLMTGQKMMALLVKDEATSFGLSITLRRSFKGSDVEAVLNELVAQHGTPKYIRSDNGGQFIATIVQQWAKRHHITLATIHPGKPWQNGFAESFVGTYRREVLNAEIFMSLAEAQAISTMWLNMYNTERPHSRHNYRPPITAFQKHAA
ncbi:IS3 family transposase [Aphanothece stagnina]|uniref:IS3 family transposase n=1 Tax=Aphanothece stagnina TaxID=1004305 RepID=UPI00398E8363